MNVEMNYTKARRQESVNFAENGVSASALSHRHAQRYQSLLHRQAPEMHMMHMMHITDFRDFLANDSALKTPIAVLWRSFLRNIAAASDQPPGRARDQRATKPESKGSIGAQSMTMMTTAAMMAARLRRQSNRTISPHVRSVAMGMTVCAVT